MISRRFWLRVEYGGPKPRSLTKCTALPLPNHAPAVNSKLGLVGRLEAAPLEAETATGYGTWPYILDHEVTPQQ